MKLFAVLGFLLVSATVADMYVIQPQIVGGIHAYPGLFTYMAALHAERNTDGVKWGTFCGSSLISDEWVLTAAHCVVDPKIVNIKLVFGSLNADTDVENDPDRLVVDVPKENIFVYEGYQPQRSMNDIALLKLAQKMTFTRMIQPVRLPSRSQPDLAGDVAVVSGWGYLGANATEDQNKLRYAQLRIFPQEICKRHFGSFFHDSNICIDGSAQSPCYGDSGSPAVVVDREDRLFTVVGVASYVSHGGCENGNPVGYARVTSFLDWIHEKTGIPIKD